MERRNNVVSFATCALGSCALAAATLSGALPAAATVTAPPIVPLPPSVPPLTVTALAAASEPGLLISSVPLVTIPAPDALVTVTE